MSEFQNATFNGTPLAIPLSASFRELFVHRNATTAWFNLAATVLTDEEDSRVLSIINGCENEILARPATSADDTVIKLLSLAQIAAEGHEPDEEIATQVILEAQRTLGLGYVYQAEPAPQSGGDSRAAWNAAWKVYSDALTAENAHDAVHIDPFLRRDLPPGPERTAAARQISPEAWEESGRLGDTRINAEDALLAMPSPDLAAFARKVIVCRADDRDLNGLDDQLVAEARRLLGDGK